MTELWLPTDIDLTKAPSEMSYKFKAALASGDVRVALSEPDEAGVRRVEMVVVTKLPLAKPKEQILVADYKREGKKGFWRNMGAKPEVPEDARFVFAAGIPFTFLNFKKDLKSELTIACVIGKKFYSVEAKQAASGSEDITCYELTIPISKATRPQKLEVEIRNGLLDSARIKLPVFGDGRLWRV